MRVVALGLVFAAALSGAGDLSHDVDARDEAGRAALLAAAGAGDLATVEALLAARADPEAATTSGRTPLLEAVREGRRAVAERLLEAGAHPDARDRALGTPLDVAERDGRHELAALLRRHGALGSGKSMGDRVCVRPWSGDGYCGRVGAVSGTAFEIAVDEVIGCASGCAASAECSAGLEVGGRSPGAVRTGSRVSVRAWCLTHTGLE
jgi:hypothetical protein